MKGFSLIELVVVAGLIALLALVALTFLGGTQHQQDLDNTAQQIAALLREARSRSVAQSSSTSWGVHLENSTTTSPFYALFFSSYSTSTRVSYYILPPTLSYDSSTISVGLSKEITFSQISGSASASTSVRIYIVNNPSLSSTISVASSGEATY